MEQKKQWVLTIYDLRFFFKFNFSQITHIFLESSEKIWKQNTKILKFQRNENSFHDLQISFD